jgi:hypothetical protein
MICAIHCFSLFSFEKLACDLVSGTTTKMQFCPSPYGMDIAVSSRVLIFLYRFAMPRRSPESCHPDNLPKSEGKGRLQIWYASISSSSVARGSAPGIDRIMLLALSLSCVISTILVMYHNLNLQNRVHHPPGLRY